MGRLSPVSVSPFPATLPGWKGAWVGREENWGSGNSLPLSSEVGGWGKLENNKGRDCARSAERAWAKADDDDDDKDVAGKADVAGPGASGAESDREEDETAAVA